MKSSAPILGSLAMVILLAGCALQGPGSLATTPTPTVTPTVACPEVDGHELPPECAPYDPEHAMEQNELYRKRMELSAEATSAAEAAAGPLRTALEDLRASGGEITVDTVSQAITDAELPLPQVREDHGSVLFGVAGPEGGCVFGSVTADAVSVEVGGYIMDGGCLTAH